MADDTILPTDVYITDSVTLKPDQHAIVLVAFYGSRRKEVVLTDSTGLMVPMTPCGNVHLRTQVINNLKGNTADIDISLTSSVNISECTVGTGEWLGIAQCTSHSAGSCPEINQEIHTSFIYPSALASPNDPMPTEAIGITIIVQAGIGPDINTP